MYYRFACEISPTDQGNCCSRVYLAKISLRLIATERGLLTSFHRVEFLFSYSEMKALRSVSLSFRKVENHGHRKGPRQRKRTVVSIPKSGFHEVGGTILTIPYLRPSDAILFMYSIGSLNSSSVGRYVGASGMS